MRRRMPIVPWSALLLVLTSCASVPPASMSSVRHAEDRLGTDSAYLDFQYHVLAEDRHASALKFEGYLLGFEKSKREVIGFDSPWLSCSFFSTYERRRAIFDESGLDYKAELLDAFPAWVNFACKRFDDRARVFLSHAVRFDFDEAPIRHLTPSILFSIYPTNHQGANAPPGVLTCADLPAVSWADGERCRGDPKLYKMGWSYVTRDLATELARKLRGGSYTHVVVASMGWNTTELETIQNYNSLMGNLLDAARPDGFRTGTGDFKPLFIGLAWPSAWTFRTGAFAGLVRGLSVINKGYDADELGLTWYGALLNVTLRSAIDDAVAQGARRPTVVTIGHSYGARALSHGVAACPFFGHLTLADCRARPGADLVIGLEGAYNRSRFLAPEPDGGYPDGTLDLYIYRDGSPLQRYDALLGNGTRHFYVWSAYDNATTRPLINFIGGAQHVCRYAAEHAARFSLVRCDTTVSKVFTNASGAGNPADERAIALDACGTAASHLEPTGPCRPDAPEPAGFVTTSDKVLLIDGSGLVHHETPLHGGGAHSDIYKWQIGSVIWQIIRDNTQAP